MKVNECTCANRGLATTLSFGQLRGSRAFSVNHFQFLPATKNAILSSTLQKKNHYVSLNMFHFIYSRCKTVSRTTRVMQQEQQIFYSEKKIASEHLMKFLSGKIFTCFHFW